jgi:hypothetical protein
MPISCTSVIHTQNGLKEIKDVEKTDMILTANGYDHVTEILENGKMQVMTIYTQDGEFTCSPEQRIAVLKNTCEYKWKKAKNLCTNDVLMSTRTCLDGKSTKIPVYTGIRIPKLDEYTAWFIGFLQTKKLHTHNADNGKFSYKFCSNDYDIALRINFMLYKFIDEDIEFERHQSYYIVSCISKDLYSYLFNCVKNDETIASYIMQGLPDIRKGFIAGIMDGNDYCREYNERDRKYLNITTASNKGFVRDLQLLCYSCGFETKLSSNGNDEYKLDTITNHSLKLIDDIKVVLKYQIISSFMNTPKGASCNSFPIRMISSKHTYINNMFGMHCRKILVDTYDEHIGQLNYCPVRVLRKCMDTKYVDAYKLSVQNTNSLYCNGYLIYN